MNNYSIVAPAKLNLNLFVKGKKSNGLHELESDICFLDLVDNIFFKFSEKDTFLQTSSNKFLLTDSKNNLILQSLDIFRKLTGWDKKFKIILDKKIPIGAGLGGGSADAAATLLLLRKLFNKEKKSKIITINNLHKLAIKLGSDVPACLESKSLKLKGYGNKITRNKFSNNYNYLLINPNIKLSTERVFSNLSTFSKQRLFNNNMFLENISIYNSLLAPAIDLAPEIYSILTVLKTIPNIIAFGMSGSGSTCFGIFNDFNDGLAISEYFNEDYFIWYGKKRDYSVNRVRCSKMLENKF